VQEFNVSLQSQMQHAAKAHTKKNQQRIQTQHDATFGEVQKIVKLGKKSDSHSGHFATRSSDGTSFPSCQ